MQSPFILAFLFTVLCILSQSGEAFWRDGREIERGKRTFPMRSHVLTKKHTPRTFANDEQFYSKVSEEELYRYTIVHKIPQGKAYELRN